MNLWQKEVVNNVELWRFAKKLFDKIEERKETIYYSGFILKELMYILSKEEFEIKREMFECTNNYRRITLSNEEYENARRIEKDVNGKISFFDIIHMLLAKKTGSILITRDNKLIRIARRYNVSALKPGQL